jgi:ribosomal protein L20A (L18A)
MAMWAYQVAYTVTYPGGKISKYQRHTNAYSAKDAVDTVKKELKRIAGNDKVKFSNIKVIHRQNLKDMK